MSLCGFCFKVRYDLNLVQGQYPGEPLKPDKKSLQLIKVHMLSKLPNRISDKKLFFSRGIFSLKVSMGAVRMLFSLLL